jgi:hypothetical protein
LAVSCQVPKVVCQSWWLPVEEDQLLDEGSLLAFLLVAIIKAFLSVPGLIDSLGRKSLEFPVVVCWCY